MIHIHDLNFCFVRIPKNASQSIVYFIYENMYKHGVDTISKKIFLNSKNRLQHIPDASSTPETGHYTAFQLIELNLVDKSTNFYAVIRCPFERQLSTYFYRCDIRGFNNPSPKHFRSLFQQGILLDENKSFMLPQYKFLSYDGYQIGNWWLYENIELELYNFCKKHKIEVRYPLKKINSSTNSKKLLINEYYTEELKQDVYSSYKSDFKIYNNQLEKSIFENN